VKCGAAFRSISIRLRLCARVFEFHDVTGPDSRIEGGGGERRELEMKDARDRRPTKFSLKVERLFRMVCLEFIVIVRDVWNLAVECTGWKQIERTDQFANFSVQSARKRGGL
jgi:hypothetical protein